MGFNPSSVKNTGRDNEIDTANNALSVKEQWPIFEYQINGINISHLASNLNTANYLSNLSAPISLLCTAVI